MHYNGEPFLDKPFTFFVAMNGKLTESIVGAIYLTVMNLPYARFKRVLLVSLIPGLNEPKGDKFFPPASSE